MLATRCALDIGSGQHKLLIAVVDAASGTIVRKVHGEQRQVLLNHDLVQNAAAGRSELSEAALAASRAVLEAFRALAVEAGATQFAGVATAVFRRAQNGEAFLDRINGELGLGLRIVSQASEGELGYLSACSGLPPPPPSDVEPLVAWDSGGGSFQISARVGGALCVWEGPVGDSNVTAALLGVQGSAFSGSSHGVRTSPNPVSAGEAAALVAKLEQELLPPPPAWLPPLLAAPGCRVVGFGERTSIFALAASIPTAGEAGPGEGARLTPASVWAAVERSLGKSDAEMAEATGADSLHDEEDLVLPKLLLLHTIMRRLGVDGVRYVRTMGNAEGVLAYEPLWSGSGEGVP
mmetsp:Transcript_28222/g.84242  ORF Transcript_28222/g.84242 Transcript_28222/m.84242 type:complete len:350 (-) Transcript_28222:24-1073(-)